MKILVIGPMPPPVTGISLANKILVDHLDFTIESINTSHQVFSEDLGTFSIKKVLFFLRKYYFIYKILFCETVYMTPGQTFFGVIKYLPFFLVSKIFRKVIIIHIHGDYVHQEYKKLNGIKKWLYKTILSMADKGIVLSETLRRNLSPFLNDDSIFVVKNFVEEEYLMDRISGNERYSGLSIFYLSNLMKEKGILDLLNALIILKKNGIEFKAKLAGNIDERAKEDIFDLIDKLAPDVEYVGVVSGIEKKQLLQENNVFCFPTYYSMEGQPIALLEAMGSGNMILTTEHGGIPDIFVNGENGFYVNKMNPEDIADKLKHIAEHPDIINNIVKRNIGLIKSEFTVKKFISDIKQVLE